MILRALHGIDDPVANYFLGMLIGRIAELLQAKSGECAVPGQPDAIEPLAMGLRGDA